MHDILRMISSHLYLSLSTAGALYLGMVAIMCMEFPPLSLMETFANVAHVGSCGNLEVICLWVV
jgi:hypothetical protein